MKIKVTVSTNKIGSQCERVIELDDDTTDNEIDKIAEDTMWEMLNWNWEKIG